MTLPEDRAAPALKTVAIIARPRKDEAADLARQIIARYPELTFMVQPHLGEQLGRPGVTDPEIAESAELMVVLGGDGTLIYGARVMMGKRQVPIVGVNLGSLGFLTEVPVSDAMELIDRAIRGQVRVASRMKLSLRLFRDERLILEEEALNDVVVTKSALAKVVGHEVWLDGAFVANYLADGIILATPTGSTAYSLSAGGPIIHPAVDCVVVTPICPHSLTQRPIVVPGDQLIKMRLTGEPSDVYLTVDGQAGLPLVAGDRLEVARSPNRTLLVANDKLDYFSVLRQKLKWGERGTSDGRPP